MLTWRCMAFFTKLNRNTVRDYIQTATSDLNVMRETENLTLFRKTLRIISTAYLHVICMNHFNEGAEKVCSYYMLNMHGSDETPKIVREHQHTSYSLNMNIYCRHVQSRAGERCLFHFSSAIFTYFLLVVRVH